MIYNNYYKFSYKPEINRLYIAIKGFWRTKEDVSGYVEDLGKILLLTEKNFTLLTDLREMKTSPKEIEEIHLAAQKELLKFGLRQTAEVVESSLVQSQTHRYSKNSEMPLEQFDSIEKAEAFLDEIALNITVV
ncbi:MAG: hypothetical protein H7Y04_04005 [Verrucomicrobia bacterium]|nr:hypothetical protein [Cytophagales bacterium]